VTTPGSGNRWEPPAEDGDAVTAEPDTAPATERPTAATNPPRRRGRGLLGTRLMLAGVALVFLLVGGAGGFLLAHSSAGGRPDLGDRFGTADHRGPIPDPDHDHRGEW
jgi:hypothetical protein